MARYNTKHRSDILDIFKSNVHESLSAKQIYDLLRDKDISISTIYRNLDEMEKLGQIARLPLKNHREVQYQYADNDHCGGIIHLVCSECGSTFHIDKNVSQLVVDMSFDTLGFKVNGQMAALYGRCSSCC